MPTCFRLSRADSIKPIIMKTKQSHRISRRGFLASTAVATAGVWLMPRWLFTGRLQIDCSGQLSYAGKFLAR
jgi:hypothetical protein